MSDWRVVVQRSKRLIGQRFWISIAAANGQTLFHSEMLKNQVYARQLAQRITEALDGNYIDLTD